MIYKNVKFMLVENGRYLEFWIIGICESIVKGRKIVIISLVVGFRKC